MLVNTNIMVTVHLSYVRLNKQWSLERDKLELIKRHPATGNALATNALLTEIGLYVPSLAIINMNPVPFRPFTYQHICCSNTKPQMETWFNANKKIPRPVK